MLPTLSVGVALERPESMWAKIRSWWADRFTPKADARDAALETLQRDYDQAIRMIEAGAKRRRS